MMRLALTLLVLLAGAGRPAHAQEWSVVAGAIGADETTTAHSGRLLSALREELAAHGIVGVRDTVQDLRVELPVAAVFGRALNLGATGAAVVQFHPLDRLHAGYAHLWVARLSGAPEERIAYVPDVTGDLSGVARGFAAAIVATLSRGSYHLVEVHAFTWPRDVAFTVGDAAPLRTTRPGREAGEGFNVWVGVRPAGQTTVRFTRQPEYVDRTIAIAVPDDTGREEPVRVLIEVSLTPAER